MSEILKFDYYYGTESEQFSFYRVPRMLIKDKRFSILSSDAKLLYGLMLDRLSLSMKNEWLDDLNRAYIIYRVDEAAEDLGVCRETAIKIMSELDSKKGIGLIEKKKLGMGKPDIIYVKNFIGVEIIQEKNIDNADKINEVENINFKKSENSTSRGGKNSLQEVEKIDFKKLENSTPGSLKNRLQEVKEIDTNYINNNYIDSNQTHLIISETSQKLNFEECELYIKKQIEYDSLLKKYGDDDQCYLDEIISILAETYFIRRKNISIGGIQLPYELVITQLKKLNKIHIGCVLDNMKENRTKIKNMKSYLLTTLYNASCTIDFYQLSENNYIKQPENKSMKVSHNKNFVSDNFSHFARHDYDFEAIEKRLLEK